jgi:hypothetical protein
VEVRVLLTRLRLVVRFVLVVADAEDGVVSFRSTDGEALTLLAIVVDVACVNCPEDDEGEEDEGIEYVGETCGGGGSTGPADAVVAVVAVVRFEAAALDVVDDPDEAAVVVAAGDDDDEEEEEPPLYPTASPATNPTTPAIA